MANQKQKANPIYSLEKYRFFCIKPMSSSGYKLILNHYIKSDVNQPKLT